MNFSYNGMQSGLAVFLVAEFGIFKIFAEWET